MPPSRLAASAPAEARNQPRVLLPRSAAVASNPPINASRYPIDLSSSCAVGVGLSGSPQSRFARSGSTRNEMPEARRMLPAASAIRSIVMNSEPNGRAGAKAADVALVDAGHLTARFSHWGAILASSHRVEGLGGYAGSGSRGVLGSLSTKVRT